MKKQYSKYYFIEIILIFVKIKLRDLNIKNMKENINDTIKAYLKIAENKSLDMGLEDSIASYAFSEEYNEELINFDEKNNSYKFTQEAIEDIKNILKIETIIDLNNIRLKFKEVDYEKNEENYFDDFLDEEIHNSYSSEHAKLKVFYNGEDDVFNVDVNISYNNDTGERVIETSVEHDRKMIEKWRLKAKLSRK